MNNNNMTVDHETIAMVNTAANVMSEIFATLSNTDPAAAQQLAAMVQEEQAKQHPNYLYNR